MGFSNGFENRMARHIDSNASFETNPDVRAAYEKTQKLFRGDAIKPQDFLDLYDKKTIETDLAKVENLKNTVFEVGSNKIAADILEGIIYEQTELSDWFGPYAHTLKTSEFDDIVNGVDLVVEFDEPLRSVSHLALGVDATYGATTIQKKFERIKRDIDQDTLATIKYFQSSDGTFKGRKSQVPRIVLGVERGTVLSLARLWTGGKNKELGSHAVQKLLLKQAKSQLSIFAEYARVRGRHESLRAYTNALMILKALPEKEAVISKESVEALYQDRVHQEILNQLDLFR